MTEQRKDYSKLYKLQNKILSCIGKTGLPFYLSGGTALGRFYLNHRQSEDLDFFTNNNPEFQNHVKIICGKISENKLSVYVEESLFNEDYYRVFVKKGNQILRIVFANMASERTGKLRTVKSCLIENPENILIHKLSALAVRDEPKDAYDILHIALNYSFNWQVIFASAKQKNDLNKAEIERRLRVFQPEQFSRISTSRRININILSTHMARLTQDILSGNENSLALAKTPLVKARPFVFDK